MYMVRDSALLMNVTCLTRYTFSCNEGLSCTGYFFLELLDKGFFQLITKTDHVFYVDIQNPDNINIHW